MKNKDTHIEIEITQQELEELQAGDDFNWTFIVAGKQINVHIVMKEYEDEAF